MKKIFAFILLVLFAVTPAWALTDLPIPTSDSILFYDVSANDNAWLTPGTGLTISGTELAVTGILDDIQGLTPDTDASIIYWSGSAWSLAKSLNIDLVLADENPDTAGQITYSATDNELLLYDDSTVYHFPNTAADTTITGDWTFEGDITIGKLADNSITADMIDDMYGYEKVPIAWMHDGSSAPATLDEASTRSPYVYRDFDSSADEDLNFVWFVPSDLSGTTVQYRVYYLITAATGPTSSEGVAFSLAGVSTGDNDVTNGTKGTAVTVTDTALDASQWDLMVTGWSSDVTITGLAAGEVAEINFERTTGDAADTYAQDVGVIAVEIRYVANPDSE